jgi:hypothetical protein
MAHELVSGFLLAGVASYALISAANADVQIRMKPGEQCWSYRGRDTRFFGDFAGEQSLTILFDLDGLPQRGHEKRRDQTRSRQVRPDGKIGTAGQYRQLHLSFVRLRGTASNRGCGKERESGFFLRQFAWLYPPNIVAVCQSHDDRTPLLAAVSQKEKSPSHGGRRGGNCGAFTVNHTKILSPFAAMLKNHARPPLSRHPGPSWNWTPASLSKITKGSMLVTDVL